LKIRFKEGIESDDEHLPWLDSIHLYF
jgi:hypothetical protein